MKFQGDILNFCDFIQVFVSTINHHLKHQQALHFGVLNYEKQHVEGTCKVLGRSVVFFAFYAEFCLCPK